MSIANLIKLGAEDPYYRHLVKESHDEKILLYAGLFDTGLLSPIDSYDWFSTLVPTADYSSIYKKYCNASNAKKVVLLTTGSFSPLHQGHLDMLKVAKVKLEQQGYCVLGSLLSPSHDSYVNLKANGLAKKPIFQRIAQIQQMIKSTDISISSWEAVVAPFALNFTDVLRRVSLELNAFVSNYKDDIEIAYVYGSDNQGFAYAFEEKGLGVCVSRSEPEKFSISFRPPRLKNVFTIDAVPSSSSICSTALRDSQYSVQSPSVDSGVYLLRDDLTQTSLIEQISVEKDFLLESLGALLFENSLCEKVVLMPVSEQRELVKEQVGARTSVSIDPLISGTNNQSLSRIFTMCSYQDKPIGFLHYPSSRNLGDVLIEDDSASGVSLKKASELWGPFKEVILANHVWLLKKGFSPSDIYDVVDARDFFLFCKKSGLLVTDGVSHTPFRVPYLYPFVDLQSRAKLSSCADLKEFSLNVLQLNKKILQKQDLCISKLDLDQQYFYRKILKVDSVLNGVLKLESALRS